MLNFIRGISDCGFVCQRLVEPVRIDRWAAVNFSARCNMENLCMDLTRCCSMKGIVSIELLN